VEERFSGSGRKIFMKWRRDFQEVEERFSGS
jgi:hypothetical protein